MHDLEALSAFTRPGILRAVIEIPAGSVEKRQYDKARGAFPIDARDGRAKRAGTGSIDVSGINGDITLKPRVIATS